MMINSVPSKILDKNLKNKFNDRLNFCIAILIFGIIFYMYYRYRNKPDKNERNYQIVKFLEKVQSFQLQEEQLKLDKIHHLRKKQFQNSSNSLPTPFSNFIR